ncbi:hypothetical protein SAMN06295888_12514 [Desulfonatronum zhilinae]|nr:hypothetical protein SAMN06295888_12514 [Desulfonatronum zhilinae]
MYVLKHSVFKAGLAGALVFCVMCCWTASALAREPFFSPTPPMEAYDFPKAADDIKLRGLLLTEDTFRAVVYIQSLRGYRVLRPMDRLEVIVDGLRHEFRVEGMGERRLVLRGQDDYWYEIGVEQRD